MKLKNICAHHVNDGKSFVIKSSCVNIFLLFTENRIIFYIPFNSIKIFNKHFNLYLRLGTRNKICMCKWNWFKTNGNENVKENRIEKCQIICYWWYLITLMLFIYLFRHWQKVSNLIWHHRLLVMFIAYINTYIHMHT